MTRITLDLSRLLSEGKLTQEDADRLLPLAEKNGRLGLLINLLMILGAIAVAGGVIALEPSAPVGLVLALTALGGGTLIYQRDLPDWRVLSHGLIIMGCLGLSGWMAWQTSEVWGAQWNWTPHAASALLFSAGAILFRQPFLAALAPLALGALIGSGTAYWHASYGIFVQEPSVSIIVFGALAGGLYVLRDRIASAYQSVATIAARVAFFMVNFAFWVGSLWGDRIGEHWRDDRGWEAMKAWRETAVNVPEIVFSLGWLAFLGGSIWLGTRDHRRFLANTAITFLAIHFYTQWFETLGAEPIAMVFAGLSMVGVAVGIARFDSWHRDKIGAPA